MTVADRRSWLTRNVRVLSVVSFLQDAASELLYPLLPIYLTSVLGAPPSVVGAVEGAAEGAASLTKMAAGPLGDRFARRPLIATGYGMAALGKVIVAAAGAWPGVMAGRVVDRLGKGLRGAPRDALLVEDVDSAARGRVFGFHRTMDTAGAVVGPLLGLAGYELLDHQIAPVLWLAVIPAVLSVLLVFLVRERARVQQVRPPMFTGIQRLPGRYWRVAAVLVAFSLVNFPDALLLLRLNEIGFGVVGVVLAYVGYNAVYALASYPAGMLADKFTPATVIKIMMLDRENWFVGEDTEQLIVSAGQAASRRVSYVLQFLNRVPDTLLRFRTDPYFFTNPVINNRRHRAGRHSGQLSDIGDTDSLFHGCYEPF